MKKRWLIIVFKLILFLIIIALTIVITESIHGNANISVQTDKHFSIVTGDTPLGGVSLVRQKVIDRGLKLPEQDDIELLANVMFYENYVNGEEVMYYTGAVVMNRVKSPEFPNTVREVLYQEHPKQYATTGKFFTKEIPQEVYLIALKILKYGTPDVPEGVLYQAMRKQGKVWKAIPSSYSSKDIEYFCYGR